MLQVAYWGEEKGCPQEQLISSIKFVIESVFDIYRFLGIIRILLKVVLWLISLLFFLHIVIHDENFSVNFFPFITILLTMGALAAVLAQAGKSLDIEFLIDKKEMLMKNASRLFISVTLFTPAYLISRLNISGELAPTVFILTECLIVISCSFAFFIMLLAFFGLLFGFFGSFKDIRWILF